MIGSVSVLAILFAAYLPSFAADFTESDWQVAFNHKVTRGQLEVQVATGRIDILTDTHAIEVDHARNYRAAIKQALQYAAETGKKPGVALVIDGANDTLQAAEAGKKLAGEAGVTFWLINEYVSVNDLSAQKPRSTDAASRADPQPKVLERAAQDQNVEKEHWLSAKTGIRHNRSCRWFGNTVSGRPCGHKEGRACKQCGG